jgi:CubicO group peptidase (beta-lactamase class C family)
MGMGGLHLTTEELSRIGQLCLDRGAWEGRQLVPSEYLAEATQCRIKGVFDMSPTVDFSAGYGYFFWMSDRVAGYRAFGNSGQHLIMLPQCGAVIAVTAQEPDDQGLLDAVWAGILPQFGL